MEHQETLVHNGTFEPNSFQIFKSYEEDQRINHTDLNLSCNFVSFEAPADPGGCLNMGMKMIL